MRRARPDISERTGTSGSDGSLERMNIVGEVVELWRYPVKSLLGERLECASVGTFGVDGDRSWAVRDEENGRVLSAKSVAALLGGRARLTNAGVAVTLPSGETFAAEDPALPRALSEWLGRAVTLVRAPGGEARAEVEADHATFRSFPGAFFDSCALHVVTTATLETLQLLYPEGRFDARRFRPNVVVRAVASDDFPEETWIGQTITIGSVRMEVIKACLRCVMTTAPQDDLPKDRGILATVARLHDNKTGVNGNVVRAGEIFVGDRVVVP